MWYSDANTSPDDIFDAIYDYDGDGVGLSGVIKADIETVTGVVGDSTTYIMDTLPSPSGIASTGTDFVKSAIKDITGVIGTGLETVGTGLGAGAKIFSAGTIASAATICVIAVVALKTGVVQKLAKSVL